MKKKLKILVVGGGMYVTGKGTNTFGTILPGLIKSSDKIEIEEILLAVTTKESANFSKRTFNKINRLCKTNIKFSAFPKIKNSKYEYKKIATKYKPDAAIICVPDHLHYKVTSFLLKLKIHCLVVKPLADNMSDAKKLRDLMIKNKTLGLVEFHKRFDEANIIIKNKIINRDIGNLLYAVIEYSQKIIIPTKIFKSWSSKSNVFQYLGVHYVDLIYFMTNFKPIKVHALGQKEILIKRNINTWDSIQVIIEWKKPNGKVFVSTHVTNWVESNNSSAMSDQKISIVGSTGKIVSDQKNRGLQVINDKDKIQDINPYFSNINYQTKKIENLFFGYGIASINNFVDCVDKIINAKISYKAFIKNNSTFIDGLVSTAVLEAVKKSLISKKSAKVILH